MQGIEQLAQLGSTLATVVLFLFYLERKDKRSKDTYDNFNQTIKNHLEHSTSVIKENSEMIRQSSIGFQKLCDAIKVFTKKKNT